ncbi:efflux RND transporter periplasmic adaptor subunit [Catellatospora tritici]|uniref:efflux RND transporter periplasmic adaptor subunit n=1 Tax=Catellatospora tritici TaxID=2851566 RepID=UPI001C2DB239|nr:biotin/lipoyl-binding protein [Catellatospora tritici]MBV1852098.1 biotin/lipoyl-binding protein [Catellatospora tritici]
MTFVVRKKRRGLLVAAGLVVVAAVAAGAVLLLDTDDAASTPPATVQVERGDVTASVAASGKVAPVATRELGFTLSGTLTSVTVKPGDEVTPGQVLATIDAADAQAAVDDATNALSQARQTLTDAEDAADASAASKASAAACASVAAKAAALSTKTSTSAAPSATATTSPSVSASASPRASASPQASASPRPSANSGGDCGSSGGGSNSGGANSGGGRGSGGDAIYSAQVSVNKAVQTLARAERDLAGTEITAPVAAKVLTVSGRAGDEVRAGTFITLGVVEQMMVQAQFAEADAVTLAVGQQAKVTLANRPGETLPVTVSQVAATSTTSGSLVRYEVLLSFDGSPDGLLIGQSATASVVLNKAEGVLYLPQSAVRVTGTGTGEVKLVDGQARQVTVGLRGDGNVEIVAGLADGDTVRLNARS